MWYNTGHVRAEYSDAHPGAIFSFLLQGDYTIGPGYDAAISINPFPSQAFSSHLVDFGGRERFKGLVQM